MRPFDEVMTLLKQGKVIPGFGNSPFPSGVTPMQSPTRLNRKLRGVRGNRPETLSDTPMRELVQDNVIDPDTGEYIPDRLEDGSPNPEMYPVMRIGGATAVAEPTSTIKSMRPFDLAWNLLKEDVKCPHCGNPSQIDPATGSPEECISCYNQKWSPMMNSATAFRDE